MKKILIPYSTKEEIANSISHGIGILFSCAAIAVMATYAAIVGDVWSIVSCSVYGATLFMLYTASTLYHAIPFPHAKTILKKCDHIAIYFLIAGTYTPYALMILREASPTVGWWVFGIEWGCAIFGCVFKIFTAGKFKILSTLLYLAMGWVAIFTIKMLWAGLPTPAAWLLLAGGFTYTIGAIFYVIKSIPYFHMVWHIFVLFGSICHFLSIVFAIGRF